MKASNYELNKGIIRTGIRLIDAHGQVLHEVPNMVGGYSTEAFFRGWFAGNAPLYLCNTLFHTAKLSEIGGFRSRYNIYDDTMAMVQMVAKYGRIDVHDIKASPRLHEYKLAFAEDIGECVKNLLPYLI